MFSQAPELYDLIYGSFKDYKGECERIAGMLHSAVPEARTVLDVACGTGEHARYLTLEHGYTVSGLDIEPAFVELARGKLPDATFWQGDMADFDLGIRFDAVLCLFSSIGYLCTIEGVERALRCFLRHLEPGGAVVVEPWFEPGAWTPGRVYLHTGESGDVRTVRMSHSTVVGRVSTLEFHYLIGSADGIEHRTESHDLGLFTRAEMVECFRRAGFDDVDFDPEGLTGRGMYVARTSPY